MAVLSQLIDPKILVTLSPTELDHLNALVHQQLFSPAAVKAAAPKVKELFARIKAQRKA